MEIDVITYIATTPKDPLGMEAWASITDYGIRQEYVSGLVINASNNQTLLEAILATMGFINLAEYSPTVFVVGNSYVVKTLTKLATGAPIHRLQVKPLRNLKMWKEIQLMGIADAYWKSVSPDNLPGSREVVHLANSLLKREQNVN